MTSYQLMSIYNKLKERKIGRCEVLQKVNDNVYKIRLPHHLKTSNVFNVQHLTFYLEEEQNSRTSSLKPEENDVLELVITSDSEQSSMSLPQLNKDMPQTDYVDSLADTFMDKWDKSRPKRRFGRVRPK